MTSKLLRSPCHHKLIPMEYESPFPLTSKIGLVGVFWLLQVFAVHRRLFPQHHAWWHCITFNRPIAKLQTRLCSACLSQFLQEQGERTAAAWPRSHELIVFNPRTFHSPSRRALNSELFPLNSFGPQACHNCFFFILYQTIQNLFSN